MQALFTVPLLLLTSGLAAERVHADNTSISRGRSRESRG